jgi:type I restriction enzyme, S subunit
LRRAYTNSASPWLDRIPEDWVESRFRYEGVISGGQVDPRAEPWSGMVLVAPNHIESGTGRLLGRETAADQGADSGKYVAIAGQVLYSKIRPALNKVAIAVEDCLCSADMYAISLSDRLETRFARYFMSAKPFHNFATAMSMRVKMPKVNREELADGPWLLPQLPEQRAIANYLDRETARIDMLIAEQQRLIEMLRERRSATIDTATHPTAEWPEIQLRRLTSAPIDAGVDEQGNPDNPYDWPRFIRTTDIASLTTLDPAKRVTVSPVAAASAALRRNDLVATRAGATIGKTYIHLSDEEACYAGYLVRIRPDVSKISPMYLAYWSQSTHYLGQVASGAVKSTIENYSAAKYRATTIRVPPLDEQRRIAVYLDAQTAKIDTLIAETERFLELARERRSALITVAVTGQIDVREMA